MDHNHSEMQAVQPKKPAFDASRRKMLSAIGVTGVGAAAVGMMAGFGHVALGLC